MYLDSVCLILNIAFPLTLVKTKNLETMFRHAYSIDFYAAQVGAFRKLTFKVFGNDN